METKALQPHQERVVTEKKELDEKLEKLQSFFKSPTFFNVHSAEQSRLRIQYSIMEAYSTVLGERISQF